jgi:hypothetical protein
MRERRVKEREEKDYRWFDPRRRGGKGKSLQEGDSNQVSLRVSSR